MIIDTPWSTRGRLAALKNAGVTGVIRYFNHRNSAKLPEKCVTRDEAREIISAGLSLAVIFQQRQDRIADFDQAKGEKAGRRARQLALDIGQPAGSAVYAAVDSDFFRVAELRKVSAFFRGFARALNPPEADVAFKVGAYGSGLVLRTLRDEGLIEYLWVSMSRGYRGTTELLDEGTWHLAQLPPETVVGGIAADKNETNPRFGHDFGQFVALRGEPAITAETQTDGDEKIELVEVVDITTRLRVTARRGLRMRAGPGIAFEVLESLPAGTIVFEKSRSGDWVCVDVEGDGLADGYCHAGFLEPVHGG